MNGPAPDRPSLRDACPADARALAALHVVSWQVAYRGHLPDHYLDTLSVDERVATWEAYLGDGAAGRMVVAEVEAELSASSPSVPPSMPTSEPPPVRSPPSTSVPTAGAPVRAGR